MPKISVIVPVYKAEKFLRRCVQSILSQTYTDFELILVDDGSPDKSGELCDCLAKTDSRIRVIHKENGGASAARNAGLDAAAGDYVMFCDSDDTVSPKWAERLYLAAKDGQTSAMCSYCGCMNELGKEQNLADVPCGKAFFVNSYYRFNKCNLAGYICNSIFNRKVIEDQKLRFRNKHSEGDYNEDLLFSLEYIRHVDRLVYVGYADYMYDVREGSLSRSFDRFYFKKYEEKYRLWRDFLKEYSSDFPEYSEDLQNTMLYHFFVSLKAEFDNRSYKRFKSIVLSPSVTECAVGAKGSNENPKMTELLKKRRVFALWHRYRMANIKNKFCRK